MRQKNYLHPRKLSASRLVILCAIWCLVKDAQAQCTNKVTALSGTQQFDCTTVTVTSSGAVSSWPALFCTDVGPHWAGNFGSGSYTFSFDPPISAVTLDIERFNNQANGVEEVAIEINGAPYFLTDPGNPGCDGTVDITATGTLIATACPPQVPDCIGATHGLQIDHTISTITVLDIATLGLPYGVFFSLYFCCGTCLADAGVINSDPLEMCQTIQANVPEATNTFLGPDDLLEYILFSDLNDTLGSIVATSNTPSFSFNPATMQADFTYYIAAVAGANLNGNVDLNSLCLDLSNAIPVKWKPMPTVTFTADNPDVCSGACTTVTATFTGSPPFSLTYNTPLDGTVVQTFPDNTGTFEVCVPAGSPTGSLVIQAVRIIDAFCQCQ